MSADYLIYLKNTDRFSICSFESYCADIGLNVTVHPAFELLKASGYQPMRLVDSRFSNEGKSAEFASGFEFFVSEYKHVPDAPKKKKGFFEKFLKPKPVKESPFDCAIKDASVFLSLSCSSEDSFEILLAYVFGAYLVKQCGGVFDDPQTGQFYDDHKHLEKEITEIQAELLRLADNGDLITHEFTHWM